jgi:DNA-binding PadR family transcriptional regulator
MLNGREEQKNPKNLPKGYTSKDIETRVVKNFLDILILIDMKKENSLSGYDLIAFVNNKFGGALSPGTIYATLYSIERKGLIKGVLDGRKTLYKLTEQGEAVVDEIMKDFNKEMADFVKKFLTL